MITEFCNVQMINPGEVNVAKMYHLGQVIGKMHNWLNLNALQSLPLHRTPNSKESMLKKWLQNWNQAHNSGQINT